MEKNRERERKEMRSKGLKKEYSVRLVKIGHVKVSSFGCRNIERKRKETKICFDDLPKALRQHILSQFALPQDITTLSLVSKKWFQKNLSFFFFRLKIFTLSLFF